MASRPEGGIVVAESFILIYRPWECKEPERQSVTLLKNHLVNAGAITQQRQAELVMTQSLKDSLYSMTPQPTSAGSVIIVTILGE